MTRIILSIVLTLMMLIYPFLVVWALQQGHLVWLSALFIIVAVLRYFIKPNTLFAPLTVLAVLCGSVSLISQQAWGLKLYPVLMSLGSFCIFALTLKFPPSMIERFARLHQPDLPESGVQWTRKVTQVWCVFFIINASIALATVVWGSHQQWAIYNGFISYVLMGILLLGEFILRKYYQNKQHSL